MAFVLVACAKETKVTMTQSNPAATQNTATATVQQQATTAQTASATPDVSALERDGMNCIKDGIRVCRPVNLQMGKVGDTVGFAFGIANLFNEPRKFAIKVSYVSTQQSLGQVAIESDKDYMNKWLAVNNINAFYELQPGEKVSKPILVKIENLVNDGVQTAPGTYVFEIQAQTYDNGFYNNYEGAQSISVKVK